MVFYAVILNAVGSLPSEQAQFVELQGQFDGADGFQVD
jgi:hypothetical protein